LYSAASVDMSAVLYDLERRIKDAEAKAKARKIGDDSLQLAMDQVGEGMYDEARQALAQARSSYQIAGATAMEAAIQELEKEIEEAKAEEQNEAAEHQESDVSTDSEPSSAADESEHAPVPAKKKRLGPGLWRKAFDESSREIYYYHTETKETQWERPGDYDSDEDRKVTETELAQNAAPDELDQDTIGDLDPKQILEYANYIGIDVSKEPHLLWIAEEGIAAPLPDGFTEHQDQEGQVYFYSKETKESTWVHPLDNHYMEMVKQYRAQHSGLPYHPAVPSGEEGDAPMRQTINMAPPRAGFMSRFK